MAENVSKQNRYFEGGSVCSTIRDPTVDITEILPVKRTFGHIFIQTNLPIYRPNDRVKIRIFLLSEKMHINLYSVRVLLKVVTP
ncbi:hypothetical protein Ahia01_001027400 [Argonauta hians]